MRTAQTKSVGDARTAFDASAGPTSGSDAFTRAPDAECVPPPPPCAVSLGREVLESRAHEDANG